MYLYNMAASVTRAAKNLDDMLAAAAAAAAASARRSGGDKRRRTQSSGAAVAAGAGAGKKDPGEGEGEEAGEQLAAPTTATMNVGSGSRGPSAAPVDAGISPYPKRALTPAPRRMAQLLVLRRGKAGRCKFNSVYQWLESAA